MHDQPSISRGLRRSLVAAVLCVMPLAATAPALAQDGDRAKTLLEDFNHYVFIAQHDLAEANARALLDMALEPQAFLALLEDTPALQRRFAEARQRALLVPQLEDEAAELFTLFDTGKKERARSPQEIEENIDMLGGQARQRLAARERLLEAGEYAVPDLITAAIKSDRIDIQAEAAQLLRDLGRDAAVPMTAAMMASPAEQQERLARILGDIPHRVSIPYLYEIAATTPVSATREAAREAIVKIDGSYDDQLGLAGLYRDLADRYFNDREAGTLLAFPGEDHQLLWSWVEGVGLTATAIRTPVFHEARAMELAATALSHNADDELAIALWLGANISRQIDQQEMAEMGTSYNNPVYDNARPSADFYASALGNAPVQRVLGRALADRDVKIARSAIAALTRVAGNAQLWEGLAGDRPLLDALAYPDRRVRYDAALAMAAADPRVAFDGAERVVPTLAGMVTQAGNRYALIVASNAAFQQDVRDALAADGYSVLAPIDTIADARVALATAPGVDLIVADLPGATMFDAYDVIRASDVLGAAPLVVVSSGSDLTNLEQIAREDALTRTLRRGVTGGEITIAASQLVEASVGAPLSDDDALIYAGFALGALRDLAISRNEVLNVSDAGPTLLEAITVTEGFVRRQVAEVLSYIPRAAAQQALAEAAVDAFEPDEQAAMLDALADSARRFGNLLEDVHEEDVVDFAINGDAGVRSSAAAAAGALGLSGARIAPVLSIEN